jgi:hypothetical protein
LIALDYLNPDHASETEVRHLKIHGGQVFQYTPEEVYRRSGDSVSWGPAINQAAAVNLGRSEWLLSFAQRHLGNCRHYRIMFYDEWLDIVCENITAAMGAYSP